MWSCGANPDIPREGVLNATFSNSYGAIDAVPSALGIGLNFSAQRLRHIPSKDIVRIYLR